MHNYEQKIQIIDNFIFTKAISDGSTDESRLLDKLLVRQFEKLKTIKDDEKVDELFKYITENQDEASNELKLVTKLTEITSDEEAAIQIRELFEPEFDDEIVDNIFEEEKSEEETTILKSLKKEDKLNEKEAKREEKRKAKLAKKEEKLERKEEKKKIKLKDLFITSSEKDDFLGIETEDLYYDKEVLSDDIDLHIVVDRIYKRNQTLNSASITNIREENIEILEDETEEEIEVLDEEEKEIEIIEIPASDKKEIEIIELFADDEDEVEEEATDTLEEVRFEPTTKTQKEEMVSMRARLEKLKRKQDKDDLSEKKVVELREIAKENGIKGISKMRKQDLIDAIKKLESIKEENDVKTLSLTK